MMRLLQQMSKLSLILSFSLNSSLTLAADLPAGLKPTQTVVQGPAPFYCTDRPGAEKIAVAFRENADCHNQIAKAESGITVTQVVIGAVLVAVAGFFIGSTFAR